VLEPETQSSDAGDQAKENPFDRPEKADDIEAAHGESRVSGECVNAEDKDEGRAEGEPEKFSHFEVGPQRQKQFSVFVRRSRGIEDSCHGCGALPFPKLTENHYSAHWRNKEGQEPAVPNNRLPAGKSVGI
jgi:hypothetical protein